jgi:hypothetical protein
MLLKIIDPVEDYEIDTINLDNYSLDTCDSETLIDLIRDIIDAYNDTCD